MDNFKTFNTAPFPGFTTADLKARLASGKASNPELMAAEIARRARRDAGDVSVMTPGERLSRLRAA